MNHIDPDRFFWGPVARCEVCGAELLLVEDVDDETEDLLDSDQPPEDIAVSWRIGYCPVCGTMDLVGDEVPPAFIVDLDLPALKDTE